MAARKRRIFKRRLSGSRPRIALLVIALVILAATHRFVPSGDLEEGAYRVERVVDGDTLVLADPTRSRVRLIGADTPETVMPNHPVEPFGKEATEFTRRFVAGGQVRLQFDGRRKDKYGRILAHVWVDDRMLSEELIRAGLAEAEMKYSYDRAIKDRLSQAEAEARAARRGIWSQ